jgi:FMN-dependent NADH-azoreductase
MPFVDESWIGANFTPADKRTADQSATLSFSDSLVHELEHADLIVVGAPVYNFSIPTALKAWIDLVMRARVTFQYTANGPVGLLKNKRAIIVMASGGTKAGSEYDFATSYLKFALSFMGVKDIALGAADALSVDPAASEAAAQKSLIAALEFVAAPRAEAA